MVFVIESSSRCLRENVTISEGKNLTLCDVKSAGAWSASINMTSYSDISYSYFVYHNQTMKDTFTTTLFITTNRALNGEVLDYECVTYFPEPDSSPADTSNRHYSKNSPLFSDSCNQTALMDVQCKMKYVRSDSLTYVEINSYA